MAGSELGQYCTRLFRAINSKILSAEPPTGGGHAFQRGAEAAFRLACEHDLEGIVTKRKSDPYLPDHASWLKIRNQSYSQWVGREELFERERGSDPDFQVWDDCALACDTVGV